MESDNKTVYKKVTRRSVIIDNMNKKKIFLIAGARPNFMKIAPLYHALKKQKWAETLIVNTGQHYDLNLSQSFFDDLGLPHAHINLNIGSGTHAEQTAGIMIAFEKLITGSRPDLVIVVGDVNSTLACSIAAKKCNIKIAHLEAGLRSFDMSMPEEINRIVTDALSDILWTPSPDADLRLRKEGKSEKSIIQVGNIMIDSVRMVLPKLKGDKTLKTLGLIKGRYGVVTLHRPSNVDGKETLTKICQSLINISKTHPLVFPLHPRTKKQLIEFDLFEKLNKISGILLLEPLNYIGFLNIIIHSYFVITDSGGVQEETTYLKIPCFTLRPNTERPITIELGSNKLSTTETIETDIARIDPAYYKRRGIPPLWDGKTAPRVVASIKKNIFRNIQKG